MEYLQSEISALREMKGDLETQLHAARQSQNLVTQKLSTDGNKALFQEIIDSVFSALRNTDQILIDLSGRNQQNT